MLCNMLGLLLQQAALPSTLLTASRKKKKMITTTAFVSVLSVGQKGDWATGLPNAATTKATDNGSPQRMMDSDDNENGNMKETWLERSK